MVAGSMAANGIEANSPLFFKWLPSYGNRGAGTFAAWRKILVRVVPPDFGSVPRLAERANEDPPPRAVVNIDEPARPIGVARLHQGEGDSVRMGPHLRQSRQPAPAEIEGRIAARAHAMEPVKPRRHSLSPARSTEVHRNSGFRPPAA